MICRLLECWFELESARWGKGGEGGGFMVTEQETVSGCWKILFLSRRCEMLSGMGKALKGGTGCMGT